MATWTRRPPPASGLQVIVPQSPGAGLPGAGAPAIVVSPPSAGSLSLLEVKVIGSVAVPAATRLPSTSRVAWPPKAAPAQPAEEPGANLTTTPGSMVRVAPLATCRQGVIT